MYTPQTAQAVAQLYQLLLAMMPRRWSSTFEKTMGYRQWDASQDTGELSFVLADGRKLVVRGQAIGSWSGQDETWVWAWANDSIHPAFSAEWARVRDLAKQERGLAAMTTGKFAARQALATELALHAAALLGAPGRVPRTGGEDSCSSPR